ncbi:MAG: geranylgeranylglycerol-phosphate geranylgeranyltransferase [Saprospiraceae bacterium]
MKYVRILRIPNLIIVALIQCLMYFGLLLPYFEKFGITPLLNHFNFALFVLDTLIITGAGYVINDIYDVEIDEINKPKIIVGKHISVKNAWIYYYTFIILGFIISFFIAFKIDRLPYLTIYGFAVALLYFYSAKLKKSFLIGNILVSAFSSAVIAILLFVEKDGLSRLKFLSLSDFNFIVSIFIVYIIFSFIVSMSREIVKDIEDLEGDRFVNANTMPVVIGISKSKMIIQFYLLITAFVLSVVVGREIYLNNYLFGILDFVLLFIPLCIIMIKLYKSKNKLDFHNVSTYIKVLMFLGLFVLFIYIFNY